MFAPIGEILELYILRNSNGKSRGCAFVTYANKYLAQQAITQLNGKQVGVWSATPASAAVNCVFVRCALPKQFWLRRYVQRSYPPVAFASLMVNKALSTHSRLTKRLN